MEEEEAERSWRGWKRREGYAELGQRKDDRRRRIEEKGKRRGAGGCCTG